MNENKSSSNLASKVGGNTQNFNMNMLSSSLK